MIENLCPLPDCRAVLNRQSNGEFDTWVCPKGHGFAATVTELWGQLQDDEIKEIWAAAKTGTPSALLSPGLGLPMVQVEVTIDDDEVMNNALENARKVTLDVAVEEEFIWFDLNEFELFPKDRENSEPSAEEQAKIKQIADQFVDTWAEQAEKHNRLAAIGNHFANTVDPHGRL